MTDMHCGGTRWSVESFCRPFPGKGHDAAAVGSHAAAVVDGATPLLSEWPQDMGHFAERAAQVLVATSELHPGMGDVELWRLVVRALSGEFEPVGYRRTAGAAVVRGLGSSVHFSLVGDVQCLVQTSGGAVRLFDQTLPRLDEAAEASADVHGALVRNRSLANAPGGYAVLGDDDLVGERACALTLPAESIDAFWMMSDGFWRGLPADPEEAASVLDALSLSSPDMVIARLEEFADDATALGCRRIA